MENASKALMIAGGVLVTVLIVTALVFMYNTTREFPRAQQQAELEKEILDFNKKYESYEGKVLKGTDVISLINMAINNNDRNYVNSNINKGEKIVTVELNIRNEIKGIEIEYEFDNTLKKVTEKNRVDARGNSITRGDYTITDTSTYSSFPWSDVLMHNGEMKGEYIYISGRNGRKIETKDVNWNHYWMRSNIASEFKRKKFECHIDAYYDTGRVSHIMIEEK